MFKHTIWLLVLGVMLGGCNRWGSVALKSDIDKASYAIGQSIGNDFKSKGIEINVKALNQGLADAIKGEAKLTPAEIQQAMANFQKEQMSKMQTKHKEDFQKNGSEGDVFLAANKTKPGVVTLPSGLQYKSLKKGTGKSPKASSMVEVHYVGTLINGQEFDSSYKRNEPARFPVNGVIPGWTEALQHMHEGDKWQLFIPAKLAYGEAGAGGIIGPNQTLLFEVELLKIL